MLKLTNFNPENSQIHQYYTLPMTGYVSYDEQCYELFLVHSIAWSCNQMDFLWKQIEFQSVVNWIQTDVKNSSSAQEHIFL